MEVRTSMVRPFGLMHGEHLFGFWFLKVIKDLIDHVFGSKKPSRSDDRVSPIGNKNVKNWLVSMLI